MTGGAGCATGGAGEPAAWLLPWGDTYGATASVSALGGHHPWARRLCGPTPESGNTGAAVPARAHTAGRPRVLVRGRPSRTPDRQRRALRHERAHGGSSHAAVRDSTARGEPEQQPRRRG